MVLPRKEYENLLYMVKMIPQDQMWFWTKEWQAKEREADKDIKMGRTSGPYRTRKELVAVLKGLKKGHA